MKYAEGEIICIIDADLQYQPKDMIKMIKHTGKYDFVNGRRTNRKDDLISKIGSLTYNFLLRIFLKIEIQDIFSGLKVFNANIYNNIKYRGLIRFLALFAHKNKFKVTETDIDYNGSVSIDEDWSYITFTETLDGEIIRIPFTASVDWYLMKKMYRDRHSKFIDAHSLNGDDSRSRESRRKGKTIEVVGVELGKLGRASLRVRGNVNISGKLVFQ